MRLEGIVEMCFGMLATLKNLAKVSAVRCRTFPQISDFIRKMPLRADLRIPDDLGEVVMLHKPSYLSLSTFCLHLIALGVDRDVTLAERPAGSVASNPSNISNTISSSSLNISSSNNNSKAVKLTKTAAKTRKSRQRPAYTEEFDALWKLYQSAPDRVSSQTKPKAFDEWKSIVALEGPETLLEAARRAIEEQKRRKTAGEFVGSLPDLFRWLRDGKYEVYLEEHKRQSGGKYWDEGNRCWVYDD
jgi:hypothetical protein